MGSMRTRAINGVKESPGRFMPVMADVDDYAFVSSKTGRAAVAEVLHRRDLGEVIAPPLAGRTDGNACRDRNWRPTSCPNDPRDASDRGGLDPRLVPKKTD
jgi:hypothetical protein